MIHSYSVVKNNTCSSNATLTHNLILGIKVRTGEEEVVCRVKLLMVVADLPAKALVLNCNQYNGKFGCSTCEHEGKQVHFISFTLIS